MRRFRERGEGQLGCIFGLVVFLAILFVAYKLVPVKVRAAEMRDTITDEARAAGNRNDAVIMKTILRKAEELELPITEEDVTITRGANSIVVDAKYTIPVEFPGYVYKWSFHHRAENPIF